MENKFCRICWNTKNWKQPTGEAAIIENGKSYVALNGFGHEEWLFNFEWLLRDYKGSSEAYKYGFLQPINKFRDKYKGEKFSTVLYTMTPEGERLLVCRIDNVYVPQDSELKWVSAQMRENGWIDQMTQDLELLDISPEIIRNAPDDEIINIKFKQEDVHFYDPMVVTSRDHKIWTLDRYHPLNWNDGYRPPVSFENIAAMNDANLKSEDKRTRSATEGTSYDPKHDRLQRLVYDYLVDLNGIKNVNYEKNFVDLTLIEALGKTFFEIKMENSVKKCIRAAIGQLIEYSNYYNASKAVKLVLVSDAIPELADKEYIRHLRKLYNIPFYYSRWNRVECCLEPEI
jgi:hypothetical protein